MMQAGKSKWILGYHLLACGILIGFVALKWPALFVPYHWDELGVYARGSLYMTDHTSGLLPANLDPEYSHGHPLLFYFLNSLAYRLFGTEVWAGHLVPLLLALSLLWMVYRTGTRLMHPLAGLGAMAMLMLQPVFYAQSVMQLPEIALALFMFLAMVNWMQGRFLLFAWWASCAIMTKETAVVLPVIALLFNLLPSAQQNGKWSLTSILSLIFPWFIYGLFLLVQRFQNGWFMFPYHVQLVKSDWASIEQNAKAYMRFIFILQGRWLMSLLGITVLTFYIYLHRSDKKNLLSPWLSMALVYIAVGFLFCSLNFYMSRYMLFLLPVGVLLLVYLLWNLKPALFLPAAIATSVLSVGHLDGKRFAVDTDMSYLSYVAAKQEVIQYLNHHAEPGDEVYAGFPFYYIFEEPRSGYQTRTTLLHLTTDTTRADWLVKATNAPELPVFRHFETQEPDTIISLFNQSVFFWIGRTQHNKYGTILP